MAKFGTKKPITNEEKLILVGEVGLNLVQVLYDKNWIFSIIRIQVNPSNRFRIN